MTCKSCGYKNVQGSAFCANCGAAMEAEPVVVEAQPAAPAPAKKTDPMSLISMILGIVGLVGNALCNCFCGCLAGVPSLLICIAGLILGIIALKKSKEAGEKNNMALAGIIMSGIGAVLFILTSLLSGAILGAAGMDMDMMEDILGDLDLY